VNSTIIIPTYDEAENIPELVRRIRASVDSVKILVMDDSPDCKTADAAWQAGCGVIRRTRNKGLAQSVIEGIGYEKGTDYIIVMDGDCQHPPETLPRIINALDKHDFVVASRYIRGGGCKDWGLGRKVISKVANWLAMPLMKFEVKDLMSGFVGFRTAGLPDLDEIKPKGFKIVTEILVRGDWHSIVEVPYIFEARKRGKSKLNSKQITAYMKQLVQLYLYKFRWIKFGIVGLTGSAVQFPVLYCLTEFAHVPYLASATVSTFFAATSNYLLNHIWTFDDRQKEHNLFRGWVKYLMMAGVTFPAYLGLLALLTEVVGLWYMLSMAITIVIMFVINYKVSGVWIWTKQKIEQIS